MNNSGTANNTAINYGRQRILVDYTEVTSQNVIEILEKAEKIHEKNASDCDYLIQYFLGEQDILKREASTTSNTNNKVVVNYALPITREIVGYTLGSPVEFVARGDKQEEVQIINDSYDYESVNTTDMCAAIYASICGVGYYITLPSTEITKDNTPEIPLIVDYLDPRSTFVVQSNVIGTPQLMSCTIIETEEVTYHICYTDTNRFIVENMEKVTTESNPIGKDPITMLENSLFLTGDWEQAISVMNATNLVTSDSLNDIEGTIRSLLVITGTEFEEGKESESLSNIKSNRLLTLVSPGGTNVDAKFIAPMLESTSVKNVREYLDEARNIITGIPDRDNNTGGDTGMAVLNRNGWTDIEIVARFKEMFIKKARKKQLEIGLEILKRLNLVGDDMRVLDVDITIGRHTTDNLSTKATAFSTLVATGELATIDALELSGLTTRTAEVVERGKAEKEEREKKAIEMAQQTGDQNNGDGEEPTGKKPEDNKTETK
jgi:SPP1 family phage portal protein